MTRAVLPAGDIEMEVTKICLELTFSVYKEKVMLGDDKCHEDKWDVVGDCKIATLIKVVREEFLQKTLS